MGWLDGALRLWPHWEFRSFGHEIANPFFPGLLVPGILFTLMYAWPMIDRRMYRDYASHNLLDRPRDKPGRTAIGVAAIAFFVDLTLASATDLLGNDLHIPFERLIEILQYGAFVGPLVAGVIAYKVCKSLLLTDAHPIKKPVGGVIYRTPEGAYHTVGAPLHGHGAHEDANGQHGAHEDRNGHGAHDGHTEHAGAHSDGAAENGGRDATGPAAHPAVAPRGDAEA
ncbi:MAG: hypothetical protein ACRDYC_03810 [Acidimicrobiales bacterium]